MPLDLEQFFAPKSIAIVGVSSTTFNLGGLSFMTRLLDGGYRGRLYPINPKADEILGVKVYPDIASLPELPDLVIICVAAPRVPDILNQCADAGLRHIHILTAGFSETGTEEGRQLEERIAAIAEERNLLVIGPNCMGPYSPSSLMTAWGAIPGRDGTLGIISQSGGITQRVTEYALHLGVGVNKAVSMGNATVLDSTDYLEFMAKDEDIRIIAMYLESVRDGSLLFKLIKEVNRHKPIILMKGGESEVGASTVASHTGRMAGQHRMWEAFFRQTGVVHARSMNEWMDAILAFTKLPGPLGRGVFIIGGGGGNSVINADTCIRHGLEVPRLSEDSMKRIRPIVPMAGSIAGNPMDLWTIYTDPSCLEEILDTVYQEDRIHMLVIDRLIPRSAYHMQDMTDPSDQFIELHRKIGHRVPTTFILDSDGGDPDLAAKGAELRARFCEAGIPTYPTMSRAVRALAHLYRYYERFGG